jgi:hypothetical protein
MRIEPMEAAAIAQPSTQRRRGRPFTPGVSGNPKGDVAKTIRERAAELRTVIVSDFDGEALTAIDGVLLDRACMLLARSERLHRTKDVDAGIRMTSEARRILQSLRRHRASAPKPLSLDEHLAAAEAAAAEAARTTDRRNGAAGHPDEEAP